MDFDGDVGEIEGLMRVHGIEAAQPTIIMFSAFRYIGLRRLSQVRGKRMSPRLYLKPFLFLVHAEIQQQTSRDWSMILRRDGQASCRYIHSSEAQPRTPAPQYSSRR